MSFVKIISSRIDAKFQRLVKVLRSGRSDVQEPVQIAPYGTDSAPIADMVGVYLPTGQNGRRVLIGYINKNAVAQPGEHRTFSTDTAGTVKFYIHQKADGTCELGGSTHNAVRYTPLNTGLQNFKTAMQAELALIAAGIAAGGGSYTPGVLSIDISQSKITEIKTP